MNLKILFNYTKYILLHKIFRKKIPLNIMWRLTNKCNSNCSYCHIIKRKQNELSTKEIFNLIDQMKQLGTQRIGLVGGECFLRKDFEKIINYIKKNNIFVTLVSNGFLVPKNLKIIKKIDYLVLSFDGRKKNHEKGRIKNSYNKLINTFEFCKKNKVKVLTNTVLNKYNLEDIDFILKIVKKYNFKATFNLLQGGNCYPNNIEYKKTLAYLIKKKKEGEPIILSKKTLLFLKNWENYKNFITIKKKKNFRCYAGELLYNIDTNGDIAACDIMSNILKKHPNVIKLGLKEAIRKVDKKKCKACTCAHVIEYNYMFSFSPKVIFDWIKLILK